MGKLNNIIQEKKQYKNILKLYMLPKGIFKILFTDVSRI